MNPYRESAANAHPLRNAKPARTTTTVEKGKIDGLNGTPDPAASGRLNDELTVLKARANEAAVTAGYTIPYPGLLPSRS